jgi:hypothetical protein
VAVNRRSSRAPWRPDSGFYVAYPPDRAET